MEREGDHDHPNRETGAGHAGNGEGHRGGDDVVDLDARVVAELAHEEEQGDELGGGEQQSGGDVVEAVGERREHGDRGQQQIGDDQRHVGHAVIGEHAGIDRREGGDQQRHGVDDLEPAADGARIGSGPPVDELGEWTQMRK